jgi:hypothetical protein
MTTFKMPDPDAFDSQMRQETYYKDTLLEAYVMCWSRLRSRVKGALLGSHSARIWRQRSEP